MNKKEFFEKIKAQMVALNAVAQNVNGNATEKEIEDAKNQIATLESYLHEIITVSLNSAMQQNIIFKNTTDENIQALNKAGIENTKAIYKGNQLFELMGVSEKDPIDFLSNKECDKFKNDQQVKNNISKNYVQILDFLSEHDEYTRGASQKINEINAENKVLGENIIIDESKEEKIYGGVNPILVNGLKKEIPEDITNDEKVNKKVLEDIEYLEKHASPYNSTVANVIYDNYLQISNGQEEKVNNEIKESIDNEDGSLFLIDKENIVKTIDNDTAKIGTNSITNEVSPLTTTIKVLNNNKEKSLDDIKKAKPIYSKEYKDFLKGMFALFEKNSMYEKGAEENEPVKKYAFYNFCNAAGKLNNIFTFRPNKHDEDVGGDEEKLKQKRHKFYTQTIPTRIDYHKQEYIVLKEIYAYMDENKELVDKMNPPGVVKMEGSYGTSRLPLEFTSDISKLNKLNGMFAIYEYCIDNDITLDELLEDPYKSVEKNQEKKYVNIDGAINKLEEVDELSQDYHIFLDTQKEVLPKLDEDGNEIIKNNQKELSQQSINEYKKSKLLAFQIERSLLSKISNSFATTLRGHDENVLKCIASLEPDAEKRKYNEHLNDLKVNTYVFGLMDKYKYNNENFLSQENMIEKLVCVDIYDGKHKIEELMPYTYNPKTLQVEATNAKPTDEYLLTNEPVNMERVYYNVNNIISTVNAIATDPANGNKNFNALNAIEQVYEAANKTVYYKGAEEGFTFDKNKKSVDNVPFAKLKEFIDDPITYIKQKELANLTPAQEQQLKQKLDVIKAKYPVNINAKFKTNVKPEIRKIETKEKNFEREYKREFNEYTRLKKEFNRASLDRKADVLEQVNAQENKLKTMSNQHLVSLREDYIKGNIPKTYYEKRMDQLAKGEIPKKLPNFFEIEGMKNANDWFKTSRFKDAEVTQEEKEALFIMEKKKMEIEKDKFIKNKIYQVEHPDKMLTNNVPEALDEKMSSIITKNEDFLKPEGNVIENNIIEKNIIENNIIDNNIIKTNIIEENEIDTREKITIEIDDKEDVKERKISEVNNNIINKEVEKINIKD